MTIRSQVEKLVSAVALTDHRPGLRLELKSPLAFHRHALRTLEINGADWRNSDPRMAALDTEGITASMLIRMLA